MKKLPFIILVIAFIGFLDASYLTANHWTHTAPPCFITTGCETVTTSSYSMIFGVPVALLGVFYYLTATVLTVAYLDKRNVLFKKIFLVASMVAFAFTLWFIYVQLAILNAVCIYCMVSATTSTVLLILALIWMAEKTDATLQLTSPTEKTK